MSERKLVRNSAHCLDCDDEIVSTHHHDFVRCSCGRLAVDGGVEYAPRVYTADARWEDTSIYEDDLDVADLGLWKWVRSQEEDDE
ncbi:hypothetical protein [Devosia sp. MC521]|uniref:DUF7695 domain-containing protein n=1 Tax=Devosia sp. MC521 TaxID=2759954 RepID=UPI0015F8E7D1|nr:hypothetical protein [Devosia sp. MC521]MBJ6986064.1 hypothetical protein [Devosia sp. MC521]QMW61434.1 hypothetical protein H4N61_10610 [Devosia sp. MC521]